MSEDVMPKEHTYVPPNEMPPRPIQPVLVGQKALVVQADVAKEEEVRSMFARMIETFGRVDILINNSGIQMNAPFDKMTLAEWQRVIDIIPWAGHVNYAAAKGGIMLLMKSIAQELAPLRIRVNSLSPGAIRTPMNLEKLTTPESYEALLSLIPYKRIGEA
jgi:glucose 1-dehydrogenase